MTHRFWSNAAAAAFCSAFLATAALSQPTSDAPGWPTLQDQLKKAGAKPGTAFERLIKDNQDFSILRADEKADQGSRSGVAEGPLAEGES